jgi:hypothetical protein
MLLMRSTVAVDWMAWTPLSVLLDPRRITSFWGRNLTMASSMAP